MPNYRNERRRWSARIGSRSTPISSIRPAIRPSIRQPLLLHPSELQLLRPTPLVLTPGTLQPFGLLLLLLHSARSSSSSSSSTTTSTTTSTTPPIHPAPIPDHLTAGSITSPDHAEPGRQSHHPLMPGSMLLAL
ncbi:hypothetical protein L1887_54648 [Cichorium endivia]|nr:hypothetical protein L1887_54648 [Cichorium endivia]